MAGVVFHSVDSVIGLNAFLESYVRYHHPVNPEYGWCSGGNIECIQLRALTPGPIESRKLTVELIASH